MSSDKQIRAGLEKGKAKKAEMQLRILHLEENPADAEKIQKIIENEHIDTAIKVVKNREEFEKAFNSEKYQIVLSEYSLSTFDGSSALELVQEKSSEIPFIFVSATLGEEQAVEAIKKGASDYVLKHHLQRLVPAIHRAIREVNQSNEKKTLQEQFYQIQKLEALGKLAGGIAHDFNNQLTVITGFTDIGLDLVENGSQVYKCLEEIKKSCERSSNLTRQLLTFSRKEQTQKQYIDLNKMILDMDKMLRRLVGENIEFKTVPNKKIGNVFADLGQLEHVLVNLVVNARDAMPNGGKLVIETSEVILDKNYVTSHPLTQAGEYIMLAVSDSGKGISSEIRKHLFEPFFTTKEKGSGTGLGLATCHAIVKQNGGHIGVYSEQGHGATFKVYLPLSKSGTEKESSEVKETIKSGNELVLLVEDEESVRKIITNMLKNRGYEVRSAKDGHEAINMLKEDSDLQKRVKLILTDMVMPQMTGVEMIGKIREFTPWIKVLFMSGYTDNFLKEKMLAPNSQFIQKPLSLQLLSEKIREILDQKASLPANPA